MNPLDEAWELLKMGVALPEDVIPLPAHMRGQRVSPQGPVRDPRYYSPSERMEYNVPEDVGVYPATPEDPHHGMSPSPHYATGGGGVGYHAGEGVYEDPAPQYDNEAYVNQLLQSLGGGYSRELLDSLPPNQKTDLLRLILERAQGGGQ